MSTKELRKLIDAVADTAGEGYVRRGRVELEAIEKAAQDIAAWGDVRPASRNADEREAVGAAEMVLRRIAKETQ